MNRLSKRSICGLLALVMLLSCGAAAPSAGDAALDRVISDTAAYLCGTVKKPQVGSVGGEWAVLGLARSGYEVPDGYFDGYYSAAEGYVTARGGVLDTRKYTEYSRVILALTALGKDPSDVAGYNLLTALGDYDMTVRQGINGPVWALIALDCGGYDVPQNPDAGTQASRELYVDYILARQLPDGGFSLTGTGGADPEITAMALQALANYTGRSDAAAAVEKALACLSVLQNAGGGFTTGSVSCAESTSQVILALCALGLEPDDPCFVKSGNTLYDNLLTFQTADGGFAHDSESESTNQMATEQALLALAALRRAYAGQNGLFEMNDWMQTGELTGDVWGGRGVVYSLVGCYRKNAPVWSETP